MSSSNRTESLVGSLENSLGSDVDPATGRHLAVHREALSLQLPKLFPVGPATNQVRVGNQHARRMLKRGEYTDRFT